MRQDPLTYEEFNPLRINQRFACSKNRIKFHNEKAKEFRQCISYITKPLLNNIRILDSVMKNKKKHLVHKQFLLGMGFSFHHNSHTEVYEGKNRFAIHHYILVPTAEENVEIINYKK